jgi:glycogen operon protein
VVYNHTGEGNERGPTISFRGIDNPSYYALTGPAAEPGRYYMNWTGCGNSLDFDDRAVIRLVMDSLRYWVEQMHVDGFRFDLASVLGRAGPGGGFQSSSAFFDAVAQDPVLQRAILVAEPWDLGTYQVGNFPVDWCEWNGRFRDTIRRYTTGHTGQLADLGWRLTGSADLYGEDGRSPYNSINFITCHDGFTLCDLVAYDHKHNERNGEDNRDGADENNSWNCGVEGPTDAPDVLAMRRRLAKNFTLVLLLASGTPMMLGGDEFLRTQQGNNNAYCQDNAISWFDWDEAARNADMTDFWRKAIQLTRRFPVLQRRKFPLAPDLHDDRLPALTWFGTDLGAPRWNDPDARTICVRLDGASAPSDAGDYLLFVIMNAAPDSQWVQLPAPRDGKRWRRVADTSLTAGDDVMDPGREVLIDPADHYIASARSTVILVAL